MTLESIRLAGMKEKILTALDDLTAIRTGTFDYSIYRLPGASVYLSLEVQREFVEGMLFADPQKWP